MFSARARFDLTPNRLSRLLDERRRAGAELVDLTESNPTRVGIPYPEDLLAPLAERASLAYDPVPAGLAGAREAVAADYRRRGFDVPPERVVLTASTSEAYSFLFRLLCDPGDTLLVPRPSYPLFEFLAQLESVRVERYPLRYDGEWHLASGDLEAMLAPRTRAVVVVNPNNPTGSYLKQGEADRLLALCAERGIAVISDEVFADYAFRPDARRLGSVAADGPALCFPLGGLSKSCGLPQLKLGWIAVAGPEPLRREALARLELIADTYLSVATPVQRAAPQLLSRLAELQRPIARRVGTNLDALRRLASGAAASLLDAEGGWYAVLRVPATLSEEERVCRLLERRGVLVHPGFFFDFASEAHLVLSLLPRPEAFERGARAILEEL